MDWLDKQTQEELSKKVQEAKEWRVKQGVAPPITGGTWPYSQSTKPSVGWSCPNCGRCFAPHVVSCSVCIGMQYWPHQPSPWWQVPSQSPWTYGTVTVAAPNTYAAPGGSGPSSGTYDLNEYQTRLDG